MTDILRVQQQFNALRCCVIIPTYNNGSTLENVIRGVLAYTDNLIIVNDGSTDKTAEVLKLFPDLTIINLSQNSGKGMALRCGFKSAIDKGFRYAITIDSDGQHFPDDLPKFLDKIEKHPDSVIIGGRNMEQSTVPGTSNFGHKFSIFWFKVETGIKIPDVQSGYRLYPLDNIGEIHHFYSRKYEFEVEILVRLAWRKVNIDWVPVKVYYAPKGERVSHFRKFRDFTRVSIMNSLLVIFALLWVRPAALARELRKKSLKEIFREYVINSKDTNVKLASSVALGIFMGVMPIWGWQMLAAFGMAHLLKLNKFVTVAASNISVPPLLPFILFLSYLTGGWILGITPTTVKYAGGMNLSWLESNLLQYLIGSLIFGVALALALGLITFVLLTIFRKNREKIHHNQATREII